MRCPIEREVEILLDYCAGKLEPEAAAELNRHLDECAECKRFVELQSAVWSGLNAFDAVDISPDFDRKLWARIESEQQRHWLAPAWLNLNWRPTLTVAFVCLLMLVAVLIQRPRPAEYVERVDAERIERAMDDLEMLRQVDTTAEELQAM